METPDLSRRWCPGCELDVDPTREIVQVAYCPEHPLVDAGADDELVGPKDKYLGGGSEPEGADCREMQQLLNRPR